MIKNFIVIFALLVLSKGDQQENFSRLLCRVLRPDLSNELCNEWFNKQSIKSGAESHYNDVEYIDYFERHLRLKLPAVTGDSGNPLDCKICKEITEIIYKLIGNTKTEAKVKEALSKVCRKVPSFMRHQCSHFVSKYTSKLIKFIVEGVPQKLICNKLGDCMSENEENKLLKVEETDSYNQCHLCKFVIYLVLRRTPHANKANLEKSFDNVCLAVPINLNKKCHKFVNDYRKPAIKLILNGITSHKEICIKLKICTRIEVDTTFKNPMQSTSQFFGCEICKMVIKTVKELIGSEPSKEVIEHVLDTVCDHLPYIKDECKSFINSNVDKLIEYLMNDLSEEMICKKLGECVTLTINMPMMTLTESQNDNLTPVDCFLCHLIVKELVKHLTKHLNKEKIEKALDKVCHHMPHFLRKKCHHFVDKYSVKIVELLLKGKAAKFLCHLLLICGNENKTKKNLSDQTLYFIPKTKYYTD